jgi:hypothetical protein
VVDLPQPYADEPSAWSMPLSARTRLGLGEYRAEANTARARLCQDLNERLAPDWRRSLLLIVAAASDTAELLSTLTGGHRTRLVHHAASDGLMLWHHDRRHGSARGQYGPDDPRWTTTTHSRREYIRQEWAARPAHDATDPDPNRPVEGRANQANDTRAADNFVRTLTS